MEYSTTKEKLAKINNNEWPLTTSNSYKSPIVPYYSYLNSSNYYPYATAA